MGTICFKGEVPLHKPLPSSRMTRSKRTSSIENTTEPVLEPVTSMRIPKGPIRSEVSESSLYYSCITRKEEGLTMSRNTTNTNKPITDSFISTDQPRIVIRPFNEGSVIRLDTNEMLKLDSKQNIENVEEVEENDDDNSGFFEANSFFKDDEDQPTAKEINPSLDAFKKFSTFSTQRTGVSETNLDYISPRHKSSERLKWMNEIDELLVQMQGISEESFTHFEKVYETRRASHRLTIYLNSYTNPEDHKVIQFKADWYIPCTAEENIRYVNTFEGLSEVIKHAENIEQCDSFEDLDDHQFSAFYICMPGPPYTKPRDFLILKSLRKLEKDKWCDVFKSIDYDSHPEYEDRTRMKILRGGHLAYKDIEREGQDRCKVKLYFEVVLDNVNSQNRTVKFLLQELKQYVERCVWNVNRFGLYHSEKTGLKHLDLLL